MNAQNIGRVVYKSKQRNSSVWQCKVKLAGKLVGIGLDKQRKQAELAAAYAAMQHLHIPVQLTEALSHRKQARWPIRASALEALA